MEGTEEPIPGERLIIIAVSDEISQSSATIAVDVHPINNYPPEIAFTGGTNIVFTEGETSPIMLGAILAPVVTDPDNTTLFLMQSAVIELLNALDESDEILDIDTEAVRTLGISISGKSPHSENYILSKY